MSLKLKCHKKTKESLKLKCIFKCNVPKTEMSLKLKITKTKKND